MGIGRVTRESRGTSTLEFAVVLPILLFIMLGSVELSRAWFTLNLATTAAREGVRTGSVVAPDEISPAGTARIDEVLAAGGITCGDTSCGTVTCSTDPCAEDAEVQATVIVTFRTVIPLFLPMLAAIDIQQVASMRYEGP